jgi:hypothetical protein
MDRQKAAVTPRHVLDADTHPAVGAGWRELPGHRLDGQSQWNRRSQFCDAGAQPEHDER